MTLDQLRPITERLLSPLVAASISIGLTPNAVSVIALVVAGGAALAFSGVATTPALGLLGALLVFANGWLDLLDGAIARERNTTSPAGDLIDHVIDRYADILVIVGVAAGCGQYWLGLTAVTGVLMTSYLGTQAQAVGLDRVYGGLVGRADRLALVGVGGVLTTVLTDPIAGFTVFGWLLILLTVVGHLTALQRFYHALVALE
ncbi:CDP-alcohol phosphatidyltransferase family protein [Halocatena halophila]|uniref:CDP-alcohol phosphatidyltransferase family protein n=1 Tax=Halocatena halophila TaxID=2814576 RepID=UPI002ED41031